MREPTDPDTSVLDPAQLIRIEAVHRGYLFQHLYAVQCLLSASAMRASSITVESDEDVEIQLDNVRIYVQVKHRIEALSGSDIESALARFAALRGSHENGQRQGSALFVIACNIAPNGPLFDKLGGLGWPADVIIDWPAAARDGRVLPAPSASLTDAVRVSSALAESLPFGTLSSETLVWKLAGVVMLAATGEKPALDHVFHAKELAVLFEQLVLQLQDLPIPPVFYRVQTDEPSLSTNERIRLIVGHSGAGKTSWLAQSALHAPHPLVYLDVADLPGGSLLNAVGREIASRIFKSGHRLGEVFLPGASGQEILRLISRHLADRGEVVTVALDNIHNVPADDLIGLTRAAGDIRFVLLARPEGEVAAFGAIAGISSESLNGWDSDTVAAVALQSGCRVDANDCQRLIDLTGGLPLFVLNALSVTRSDYDGSAGRFCADLSRSANTRETAQEFILGRVFNRLPNASAEVADMLSLCDASMTREEAASYIAAASGTEKSVFLRSLRHLLDRGLLQAFAADKIRMHDAARTIGKGRLALLGATALKLRREALRTVIIKSLSASWSSAKLSLFLRLTGEVGQLETLAEMAIDEIFHEIGVWPEVEAFLIQGAQDESAPPEQRIKVLDGLAFADLKAGSERAGSWLDRMDELIARHELGAEERLRVSMKRMNLLAGKGDRKGARNIITRISTSISELSEGHQRVFEYNAACAEMALGDPAAAIGRVEPLIEAYYDLIGLAPLTVMGKNIPDLLPLLKEGTDHDDLKHLADCLDVLAKAQDARGLFSPFARIHALKFYALAQAPDSIFRVGQNFVDQYIAIHDYDGALQFMDSIVLPQLRQWKLVDYLVPVRSQYAVVLAYCGRHSDADTEMARLASYAPGLSPKGRGELENQSRLIARLRHYGPPPKWVAPVGSIERARAAISELASYPRAQSPALLSKVGRNNRCPCGSGKKYKHCHGSRVNW